MNGQSSNSQDVEKGESIQRNASFNVDEIKVRWKKAALENCPGVPCVTVTVPGSPTIVNVVAGNAQATVSFTAPSSTGGSAITSYTVTSTPVGGTGSGTGSPLTVTGLSNGTSYIFTVIATNAVGNSLASAASNAVTPAAPFLCGTSTISDIDGNSYNTVSIGTQCWTKDNLRVRRYNDGTEIKFDASGGSRGSSSTWQILTIGAHTIYANDSVASPSNLTTYGYLYNWYAAKGIATAGSTTYKNVCPIGWHVPTDGEWTSLIQFIVPSETLRTFPGIQSTTAGGKMKSTGDNTAGTGLWNSPNTGADNASGFTALPGGYRELDGSFYFIRGLAFFWSATEMIGGSAWNRDLDNSNSNAGRYNYSKEAGASVRCLRD